MLRVDSKPCNRDGRIVWEHRLHGLGRNLSPTTLEVFGAVVQALCESDRRVVLAFSPLFEEDWAAIASADWTTTVHLPAHEVGRRIVQRAWVVGYAHTREKFTGVYDYAWRCAMNEPVVVLFAPSDDDGTLLTSLREQVYPGNEMRLIEFYDPVIGRYFDGLWITVLSRRVDRARLLTLLRRAAADVQNVEVDETTTP